jgi:hypothetical protein
MAKQELPVLKGFELAFFPSDRIERVQLSIDQVAEPNFYTITPGISGGVASTAPKLHINVCFT